MKTFRLFASASVVLLGGLASGFAQGPSGSVTVRFGATIASYLGTSDAEVTVEAERPDGVIEASMSSGSGGGQYAANPESVTLEPGRSYHAHVYSHGTSTILLRWAPPPGYLVYWENQTAADREFAISTPTDAEFYDNTFLFRILPEPASLPVMPAGTASSLANGGGYWHISLGALPNGQSAGYLELVDSGRASGGFSDAYNLFTGLNYSLVSDDVQTLSYGSSRQIVAFETGVNIVSFGSGYQIKFYHRGQVVDNGLSASPRFSYSGDPFISYLVEPNGSSTSLKITCETRQLPDLTTSGLPPVRTSVTTLARSGTWPAYGWTRDDWATQGNTALARDTRLWSAGGGSLDHNEAVQILKPGDSVDASYATRTYVEKGWGEALTADVRGSSDAVTTNYYYYETASDVGSYTYPKLITTTGGSWQAFEYYAAQFTSDPLTDTSAKVGAIKRSHRPYLNTAAPASSDDLSARTSGEITSYQYSDDAFTKVWGQSVRPILIETRLDDTLTAKAVIAYTDSTFTVNGQLRPLVTATRSDYPSSGGTALTTTTKYFREDTADLFYRGQPHSITRPDGTRDAFAYEKGSLSGTTFTPASSGTASRLTVIHGTATGMLSPPALSYYPLETVYMVDKKSTMEITLRDSSAHVVRVEQYVWNTSGWQLVSSVDFGYDYAGHVTSRTASNGAVDEAVYNGDQKQSGTDASGIQLTYTYDVAGRVDTAQKEAGTGSSVLTTKFAYDAENRVTQQTIGYGLSETLVSSHSFDDAGRLTSEARPGPNGVTTTSYSYNPGARTVTVTLPTTATRIETYQPDGGLDNVTGTAVVPEYYTRQIQTGGVRYVRVNVGTTTGSRLRESWSDWLGRTTKTSQPGFTGQVAFEKQASFDASTGQLTKTTRTGYADTLYEYDALSRPTRSGLDLGGTAGTLDPTLTDRIMDADQYFENYNSAWWLTSVRKTYPTANNGTALTISTVRQRLTGFTGSLQAETLSTDVDGNTEDRTVDVNRTTKTVTVTTNVKDGTASHNPVYGNDQIETIVNGLTTSVTRFDGLTYGAGYDTLHRRTTSVDPRTGTSTTYYNSGSTFVSYVRDPAGNNVATYAYDGAGRVITVTDAAGHHTYTDYNTLDQVVHQWGDASYPVAYGYDAFGARTTMSTYRGGSGWTNIPWSNTSPGTADTTTWNYDGPSGLLSSKVDAKGNAVSYTYNARGQTAQRTWARGVTTTYGYDSLTGELVSQTYSDGTPSVTYSYTRTGQANSIADYTGTRGFAYNGTNPLQLDAVNLPGFYGSRALTRQYDSIHRAAGFAIGSEVTQTYAYNTLGRFDHLTSVSAAQASRQFDYGYNGGGLVSGLTISGSAFAVSRDYDPNRDLLTKIDSLWSGTSRTRYDYHYNSLAQRDKSTQSGDVFADFGDANTVTTHSYVYNSRGELIDAADYLGSDTTNLANQLSGRHHALTYDNMGNRLTASRTGTAGTADTYAPDNANQYGNRTNNYAHTAGTVANSSVGVSVTGGSFTSGVGRQGRYWDAQVALNNGGGPASAPLTITGTWPNGAGTNIDLYYTDTSRKAYLAAALQIFSYDDDGNMIGDGIWNYTYDAENRLTGMSTTGVAVSAGFPNRLLEFKYDYLGRRVQKRSLNSTAGTETYRRYLYDGDNLVAEFDAPGGSSLGSLLKSYTWGLDLAGSLDATGGVGALVQLTDHATSTSYFPTFDGNGNVASLLRASDGAVVAKYEYSPFGELLRCEGTYAKENPFRFSTKFTDEESGLVYYGARFYSPSLGRFINRDPAGEAGGLNLYGFCGNDGINRFDRLGFEDPIVMPTFTVVGSQIGGPPGAVIGAIIGAAVDVFGLGHLFGFGGGHAALPKPKTISNPRPSNSRGFYNPITDKYVTDGIWAHTDVMEGYKMEPFFVNESTITAYHAPTLGESIAGFSRGFVRQWSAAVSALAHPVVTTKEIWNPTLRERLVPYGSKIDEALARTGIQLNSPYGVGQIAGDISIAAATWRASTVLGGSLSAFGDGLAAETEIPTIGGRLPINSKYAGGAHPAGVEFTERGFPDFGPHSVADVELKGLTGDYGVDSRLANEAMGYPRTPEGYTWHHVEDGRTMQLVPQEIHQAVRHTGGAAVIRNGGFDP